MVGISHTIAMTDIHGEFVYGRQRVDQPKVIRSRGEMWVAAGSEGEAKLMASR